MTAADAPLVRFGKRQSKGLLLGFSGLRLTAIGAAIAIVVAAMFTRGEIGLLLAAPLWVGLLAVAFVRWQGEPVADSLPVIGHWAIRRAAGQTAYRVRPTAPRPAGTLALPGDAAALRFHMDPASGAVMIHDPHRRTLAAVVRVSHPAYVLLSPDDQARRVAAWSRVIAGLATSGTCASVQILESTLPDPGRGVHEWYATHGRHDGSWAATQYAELVQHAAPASYSHRTLIALNLDLRRCAAAIKDAGRGIAGAAAVLRGDMTTFAAALQSADLRVERWLAADEMATVIRDAYDPRPEATDALASLATAGPIAIDEHWDHLRHDSAYSAVLWLSEWPRIDVAPHFLHSLVFLQDVRKSMSIVATPLPTGDALRAIRKEKVEYVAEAHQAAKIGRIADLSMEQEYTDVLARERALISGHADLRFSGFVTVTASTRDALSVAAAAAQRAAVQCGCETKLLYGRQAQAFTLAALPLGRTA